MAAPTPTARPTPVGQPMLDGYSTLVAFEADPEVLFWEKGVKPPGIEGGDNIEASSMHNTTWHTFGIPSLKTLTDAEIRAAYDPALFSSILALVNIPTVITIHFPDDSTYAFYGRLKSFEPDELVAGTQPECTIVIAATNWDPSENEEAAPVYGT
jgi:hypothetical protein